jgi:predicted alpha/beta-hydrolase family hydrolase
VILSFETTNARGRAVEHQTSAVAYRADVPVAEVTLVLAHGAGAPQQSAFMVGFANALTERGIDVLTFNFLYTEQRRRIPDRTDMLEACYRGAVRAAREHFGRPAVFVGGKSMGGRIATHLAAADDAEAMGIRGVVLLGYPLHPPGKPEQLRTGHLARVRVPMLIVQGERDPFGTPEELRPVIAAMAAAVTLHVVANGDHSLAPSRKRDAVAAAYRDIQDAIARWLSAAEPIVRTAKTRS